MIVYKSYTNPRTNMQSQVRVRKDGRFAVALIDLDSGRQIPIVRIWTNEGLAIDYARYLVQQEAA